METIVVGVTGINSADNPGPGIGVARSLKEDQELNVKTVGLAYDALEPGLYMDWVIDRSFILPYPSKGGMSYINRLLDVKSKYGLDAVIPNLDSELPIYIKYADTLARNGLRVFLPDMKGFQLRGKDCLGEVARSVGIRTPTTEVVSSVDGLVQAVNRIGLPVMVKGKLYGAYLARTIPEAIGHYHHVVIQGGYPVIVQQVVNGDHLNVVGLGDGRGRSLGHVGIKKITLTSLGKIWTGVTIHNEPIRIAAERFMRSFRWQGPFELECIASGDDVYLIEVNPRFPAWCYFATGVGINLPARLLRRIMGLDIPPLDKYPSGKLFVRYSFDMVTDMLNFQNLLLKGESI